MPNSEWAEGFRQRLEVLHTRFGTSKARMARECGLPPRTLENYFKGQQPSVKTLLAISRGMGVDIDWLIGEPTEEKNFNLDMVGEASHNVMYPFLTVLASQIAEGRTPISGDTIMGKSLYQMASELEWKIRAEYVELRREYGMDTLEEARAHNRGREIQNTK